MTATQRAAPSADLSTASCRTVAMGQKAIRGIAFSCAARTDEPAVRRLAARRRSCRFGYAWSGRGGVVVPRQARLRL